MKGSNTQLIEPVQVCYADLQVNTEVFSYEYEKMILLKEISELRNFFGLHVYAFNVLDDYLQLLLSGDHFSPKKIRHFLNALLERWRMRLAMNGEEDALTDDCVRAARAVKVPQEDAVEVLRFIHLTPVTMGYVHEPGDWWWSSYQSYRERHEWEMLDLNAFADVLKRRTGRNVQMFSEVHRRGAACGNPQPSCLRGVPFKPLTRTYGLGPAGEPPAS
jgi:hypothetical protein